MLLRAIGIIVMCCGIAFAILAAIIAPTTAEQEALLRLTFGKSCLLTALGLFIIALTLPTKEPPPHD